MDIGFGQVMFSLFNWKYDLDMNSVTNRNIKILLNYLNNIISFFFKLSVSNRNILLFFLNGWEIGYELLTKWTKVWADCKGLWRTEACCAACNSWCHKELDVT